MAEGSRCWGGGGYEGVTGFPQHFSGNSAGADGLYIYKRKKIVVAVMSSVVLYFQKQFILELKHINCLIFYYNHDIMVYPNANIFF